MPTSVSGYASAVPPACLAKIDAREIFEVDLVDDARVGRHDAEILEGVLAPPQKRVALLVARELERRVELGRVGSAEVIDLHGVIDHEFDRLQRIDLSGSPPSRTMPSRIAARSTTAGTPVKSCSSTRAGVKADLLLRARCDVPAGQRLDVVGVNESAVFVAQQVLEQDLQRIRQPRRRRDTRRARAPED